MTTYNIGHGRESVDLGCQPLLIRSSGVKMAKPSRDTPDFRNTLILKNISLNREKGLSYRKWDYLSRSYDKIAKRWFRR